MNKTFIVLIVALGFTLQGMAQKPDFAASWKGLVTKKEVGYPHSPYLALEEIYSLANTKKVLINDYSTDYVFHDGMLAVYNRETRGWGFVDENGNLLPGGYKWKSARDTQSPAFGSGHCIVGLPSASSASSFRHTDFYVLDKLGHTVKLPVQDLANIYPFNNRGIAAVIPAGFDSKVLFFNTSGQQVFRNITNAASSYAESPLGDFSDGWARLKLGQGYTFVSPTGTLMQKTFSAAQGFSDGLAAVATQTGSGLRWGFIDATGSFVIEPKFSKEPSPFSYGYAVVTKTNGKKVFINKQGTVCSEEADYYTNFVNGYALGTVREYSGGNSKGGQVWVIDTQMQRKPVQSQILGGASMEYICKVLPVPTAFNDTYIYREDWLIYPPTGQVYCLYAPDIEIKYAGSRRMHIKYKGTFNGVNKLWDGFLDQRGYIVFVFDKEEF